MNRNLVGAAVCAIVACVAMPAFAQQGRLKAKTYANGTVRIIYDSKACTLSVKNINDRVEGGGSVYFPNGLEVRTFAPDAEGNSVSTGRVDLPNFPASLAFGESVRYLFDPANRTWVSSGISSGQRFNRCDWSAWFYGRVNNDSVRNNGVRFIQSNTVLNNARIATRSGRRTF